VLRFFESEHGRERPRSPEAYQGGCERGPVHPLGARSSPPERRHGPSMGRRDCSQLQGEPHRRPRVLLTSRRMARSLATASLPQSRPSASGTGNRPPCARMADNVTLTGAEALAFSPDGTPPLYWSDHGSQGTRGARRDVKRTAVQPQFAWQNEPGRPPGCLPPPSAREIVSWL